jgi:lysophospholipase L1-like esterase
MEAIIRVARGNGIKVVLATFAIDQDKHNWMDYLPAELWPRGVAEDNESIRRLAQRYDLPLIDYSSYVLGDKTMFYDSIHPTDDGNRLQGEFFARTLGPLIAGELKVTDNPPQ